MQTRAAILGVLAVATLLAVAVGAGMAANGTDGQSSDGQTVSVAGSGEVDATPDAAVVRLSVTARGQNAANVSDEIAAGASDLRETLTAFGIDESNVQTQGYRIREDRPRNEGASDPVYVGQQTFEVTLEDVDRVGSLVDAAVDGGADDVGGVHYTLSEGRRDQIRDRALRDAIEDARAEAGVIAEATDLRLDGVKRATSQETSLRPYRADVEMSAADGGGGTDIDPQDVTVSATVEVTFAATGA